MQSTGQTSTHDRSFTLMQGSAMMYVIQAPGIARRSGRQIRAELRSEEHTSELQSQSNLVCRLLLEKKKKKTICRVPGATHDSLNVNYRYPLVLSRTSL